MVTVRIMGAGFSYPDKTIALHQVDTTILPSTVMALAGPNGAGKTTLAKLINGVLVPSRGKVIVDGYDTTKVPASLIAQKVGYVFHDPKKQIFAGSVYEEASFGPRNMGKTEEEVKLLVEEALEFQGLSKKRNLAPYELSYTEMRRLALASVISMNTPVVILDEPTASLDAPGYRLLLDTVNMLKKRNTTIIIITHDMDFASEVCNRVLYLKQGRIAKDGNTADVLKNDTDECIDTPFSARLALRLGL